MMKRLTSRRHLPRNASKLQHKLRQKQGAARRLVIESMEDRRLLAMLFDVNVDAGSPSQAGFTAVDAGNINDVTFTAVGAGVIIDDRDRTNGNTDGAGGDTANNDMWRDFIFANGSDAAGEGLDITIANLSANTTYDVRLWAFDDSSGGGRTASWNGSTLTIPDSPDPTSLNTQVVSFQATTDVSGTLVLEGRFVSGAAHTRFR
jgi:hypothetical protein